MTRSEFIQISEELEDLIVAYESAQLLGGSADGLSSIDLARVMVPINQNFRGLVDHLEQRLHVYRPLRVVRGGKEK